MKQKYLPILIVFALVLAFGGLYYFYPRSVATNFPPRPKSSDLAKIYDRAVSAEEKIKKNTDDSEMYLDAGWAWKSLGDQTNDARYYDLSAEIYRKGTEKFGKGNYIFWLNLGNLKIIAGKYDDAEKAYRGGLENLPKEPQLYLALVELYRYNLHKSADDIVKIYEEALNNIPAKEQILNSYAPYLKEIGNYKDALFYFEQLSKVYPDQDIFRQEIVELKTKVK